MSSVSVQTQQTSVATTDEDCRMVKLCALLLREGNAVRMRLGGGSMRPFMRHGDYCVLEPSTSKRPELGNIVAYFNSTGKLTVHRIVAVRHKDGKPGFMVKGDMVMWKEWVAADTILGRMVSIERYGKGKRLDTALERVGGKVVAVLSPVLSFVGLFVLSLVQAVRGASPRHSSETASGTSKPSSSP